MLSMSLCCDIDYFSSDLESLSLVTLIGVSFDISVHFVDFSRELGVSFEPQTLQ